MSATSDANQYSFEEFINNHGYLLYTNVGGSMLPFLREKKDIIEICPVQRKIKKYEVVLYKKSNKYILHRCISSSSAGYVFAGDHNTFKEYGVKDEDIIGVMTRVVRNGRSIYPSNLLYKVYYHLWVDFFSIRVILLRGKLVVHLVVKRILSLIRKFL